MNYRFLFPDCRFGISYDNKSFIILGKDGCTVFTDVDAFLADLKKYIESLNKKSDE